MSDTPNGSTRKMDALRQLRELSQDPDQALYMLAYCTAAFTAEELEETVRSCLQWIALSTPEAPRYVFNGEWIDRQDLGGPNERPPHPR